MSIIVKPLDKDKEKPLPIDLQLLIRSRVKSEPRPPGPCPAVLPAPPAAPAPKAPPATKPTEPVIPLPAPALKPPPFAKPPEPVSPPPAPAQRHLLVSQIPGASERSRFTGSEAAVPGESQGRGLRQAGDKAKTPAAETPPRPKESETAKGPVGKQPRFAEGSY